MSYFDYKIVYHIVHDGWIGCCKVRRGLRVTVRKPQIRGRYEYMYIKGSVRSREVGDLETNGRETDLFT